MKANDELILGSYRRRIFLLVVRFVVEAASIVLAARWFGWRMGLIVIFLLWARNVEISRLRT